MLQSCLNLATILKGVKSESAGYIVDSNILWIWISVSALVQIINKLTS